MRFERKQFFDNYRKAFGTLDQEQVDGLEFLLGAIESDPEWQSIQQISYVLATVYHETDRTFQPIEEYRSRAGTKARINQDRYWEPYRGRGYVQLTWQRNYEKFGIADNPKKALEPRTAYRILSEGMREGVFTGKKLSDYINGEEVDYVHARMVVNGLDKANQIAGIAEKFEHILKTASVAATVTKAEEPKEPEVPEQKPEPPAAPQAPKPEVTPVAAPATSITTKIAAAASAAAPVVAATGLKIGGVEFHTGGLIAIATVIIVGMVLAAYLWNQSQERAFQRQKLSIENLASDNRGNVIAAGSKV